MIRETKDLREINNIILDDEIFQRISEEGDSKDVTIELDEYIFLTNEDNTALMIYEELYPKTYECHVQVLKDHRNKAMDFGKEALDWLWDNTEATDIVAEIPECYPDVYNFAIKNGFKDNGVSAQMYRKKEEYIPIRKLRLVREVA